MTFKQKTVNELRRMDLVALHAEQAAMKQNIGKEDKGVKLKRASEGKASDADDVVDEREYINCIRRVMWEKGASKVKYPLYGAKS